MEKQEYLRELPPFRQHHQATLVNLLFFLFFGTPEKSRRLRLRSDQIVNIIRFSCKDRHF